MAKLALMVTVILIINSFANAIEQKTTPNIIVTKDSLSFSNEITFGPTVEKLKIEKINCGIQRPKATTMNKAVTITPKSYDVLKKSYCQHSVKIQNGNKETYSVCKSSLNTIEKIKDECEAVDERGFYVNDELHLFVKDKKSDLELELICENSTATCEAYLNKGFLTLRNAEITLNRNSRINNNNYEPFLSFLSVPKDARKDQTEDPQQDAVGN